jgi:hypothetical protein
LLFVETKTEEAYGKMNAFCRESVVKFGNCFKKQAGNTFQLKENRETVIIITIPRRVAPARWIGRWTVPGSHEEEENR